MMVTIKDIYNHCKSNNKPMLMISNQLLNLYPTFPNTSANFVRDYTSNYKKYDKAFTQKFMSKSPIFIDEKQSFPAIYDEWVESCTDFIAVNLYNFAYLYHAINDEENYWNPTHNYDGTEEVHTGGILNESSGKDTTTISLGKGKTTDKIGNTSATSTDYEVPYDNTGERESNKNITTTDTITNTSEVDAKTDKNETSYGKKEETDYTVTTTKGGNLGVSTVPQMVKELYTLESFWDNLFNYLSKELTIWSV